MSMTDTAVQVLQVKGPLGFQDLWKQVANTLQYSEDIQNQKMGLFYQNLTLDARVSLATDNLWHLKNTMCFSETFVDVEALLDDSDDVNWSISENAEEDIAEEDVDSESTNEQEFERGDEDDTCGQ